MKVSSIDKDIKAILESGYYQVPRFQRPYSWEKENVIEFWRDISNEFDEEYFIGSMVVFKKKQSHFGIVDGQQRLTTLTLLLAGIRDQLNDFGNSDLAKGVQRLIERKDIENKDQFIIQTETSYPYFHQCIQKYDQKETIESVNDEEKALKKAFDVVRELIQEQLINFKSNEDKINYLNNLRDQILRLKVIFIELDNEDDAYIIFETLNTRGKDLQTADLVKNHFTKVIKLKNTNVDRVRDKWTKLLENIQTSNIEIDINTFIYHYWLSKETYTTQKNLFKEFKKLVTQSNATAHLDSLLTESEYYRTIYEPTFTKWKNEEEQIKASLEALSIFRVRQPLPLVLAIISEYFAKKLKLKTAKKYLSVIENFHFLHNAVTSKRSSGGLSQYYAKKARELRQEKTEASKIKVLETVRKKLSQDKPDFNEFRFSFNSLMYSDHFSKDKKLVQYILKKIDQKERNFTPINYTLMTIEHIAGQNESGFEGKDIAKIGNLVLVSSKDNNEKLTDMNFSEKKDYLNKNYPHFDNNILRASKWAKSEIESRSEYLSNEAFKNVWKLE